MNECQNTRPCPCTVTNCSRHGKCCECVAHHRDVEIGVPGCFFTKEGEALWKRDLDTFFKDRGIAK